MSTVVKTEIQILDSSLNLITPILTPYPLNKTGDIVQYSKELSDFGQCKFRVSTYDTLFATYGDILIPHQYHVRLVRNGVTVWQGAIIENGKRTKDYIEVTCAEYLWYLQKKLIHRTSNNPSTGKADNVYRIFTNQYMNTAVTAIMNETITDWQSSNHALASLTLGTVQCPNYPPNMKDGNNPPNPLTGLFHFGNGTDGPQLTFDFHSVLYVLKSFCAYSNADFTIDNTLAFQFKPFLGSDKRNLVSFSYGKFGNAVDFNLPRLGERQVNSLWGVASDNNGTILFSNQQDQATIGVSGLLEGTAAYIDIKDQASLNARIAAELPLVSSVEEAATTMTLDEKAYPLGLFDVGDIVNWQVNHTGITYNQPRRIVGLSTTVHNTGRELTTVQGNQLIPWVMPS